ncbi:MAG: AMP-binding protein [archaeon]|jgi:acetyl-CoA synthetase|nr:AMP-binding protein [archaeon]
MSWNKAEKDIVMHRGKMNIIESCVDRHAENAGDRIAFVFEDESMGIVAYTYEQLEKEVNKFANMLKNLGVRKKSRVFIFLPKIPEMYVSFLGTIKHGSIAAPLFEAFQEDGLMLRLERGDADVLITNSELLKRVPKNVKKRVKSLKHVLVVDSPEYKEQKAKCSSDFNAEMMAKEDTALMIFTSSTAGTPVAGVEIPHYALVQQHFTGKLVLDLNEFDNYWCTAHPAWVTGSVYGIIAPLSIGCTNYALEAHFDAGKWIDFIVKHKINVIYTAPTALKLLKSSIAKEDLASVRNICSVGEALPKTIFEHYKKLGVEINDSYWQSETGAMVIANYPGMKKKAGSIGKTLPGITAKIKDEMMELKKGWPAMMTGIYKHDAMYKSYFDGGWFKTNDRATRDKDGYFFFLGRRDDIIKTSGERVSPLEIENILLKHKAVHESAVIGVPDKIKGEIIKAFVVLNAGIRPTNALKDEIAMFVKRNYAGHAYPKIVEFVPSLPKTNSGKIMRMYLREKEAKKAKK